MSTALPEKALSDTVSDSIARFRPDIGESVRVASPQQIMLSLDQNGQTGGMPFMPEMLRYSGQVFPVLRWANTVCVYGETIQFRRLDDCVVLQMPRCCGTAHAGCQMACAFFWSTKWLSSLDDQAATQADNVDTSSNSSLGSLLQSKTTTDDGFQCQATQLGSITRDGSGAMKRFGDEYNLNRVRLTHLASDLCSTLLAKATRTQAGLSGTCTGRTPARDLALNVGELVRVRSKKQILATLNSQGKNRGLWFDPAMLRYCGQMMQVTQRVTQFIHESSGQMVRPSVPSIVLDEEHCSGNGRRFCSRLLHFFWREIWLERDE